MDLSGIGNFFAYIPLDWIIIAALAILLAFDCLRSGTKRVIALSLAFPLAYLLFASISSARFLSSLSAQSASPMLQSLLFGAILVGMYFMMRRISSGYGRSEIALAQSAIASLAASAIVIVIWLQVPALQSIWHFGPQIQAVFGEAYKFWWLLAAYAALAFVRR